MADIVCPSCKNIYHETTSKYDPNKPLNGAMFKKKDSVPTTWWCFAEVETTQAGHIECPNCETLYDNGSGLLFAGKEPYKKKQIPESMNAKIVTLYEEGMTATDIGNLVGFSRQAIGRRLYDLGKGKQ